MSLATERWKGWLVCQCPRPTWRMVTLFDRGGGGIILTDVFECARCGRAVIKPAPPAN